MAIGERFPKVLSAAAEGADWAWAELYRDLAPGLLRFLRAHGAADPEDCLGEFFVQLVRHLPSFSGSEEEFRVWVFTVARSRLIDAWRRDQRRPASSGADALESAERALVFVEPEAPALQRAAVEELLGQLSPDQRDVLLLRYLQQFSPAEVAEILGKREGAVRVLQHRALNALRRNLAARGVHPSPRATVAAGRPELS